MVFVNLVIFIFFGRVIFGAYHHIIFIKQMRGKRNYKGAILDITEKVVREGEVDLSAWILMMILEIGRALIGFLLLFLLFFKLRDSNLILYPKNLLWLFVSVFFCFYAVWISGYLFGKLIARPFENLFAKTRYVAIGKQGIYFAGKLIPWGYFRGYYASTEKRYINLFSKNYPNWVGFSFVPTSIDDFHLLVDEIKKHLPSCDLDYSEDKHLLYENIYFQAVVLSVGLFLIGLASLKLPAEFGIMLNSLLMYLQPMLALKIIRRIIPASQQPNTEIE